MNTPGSKETAERIVDMVLKSLGKENEPMRPLLEVYVKKELEEYHKNQFTS